LQFVHQQTVVVVVAAVVIIFPPQLQTRFRVLIFSPFKTFFPQKLFWGIREKVKQRGLGLL